MKIKQKPSIKPVRCWCIATVGGTLLLRSLGRTKSHSESLGGGYGKAVKVEIRPTNKKPNVPRKSKY